MVATEAYWFIHDWLENRDVQGRAHFQHYLANIRGNGLALVSWFRSSLH
jgi:hypothetical protein